MAAFAQYAQYDATGLADLVRRGETTPAEIAEAAFAAIERLNPLINAVVTLMHEQARAQIAAGLAPGAFSGAPMICKDECVSYAGVPNHLSSRLCAGYTRPYDSHLIQRYKQAGIVIVGKANLPEFGAGVTTEPLFSGRCSNPWDLERTSGGSSGGSAAGVASGMVPFAYANDGGGSIRIPASCCGVFGLKPTRGRVSTSPEGEYWNGLIIEHAITRSVRDSATLLDLSEGYMPGDPYCAPPKIRRYSEEIASEPGRLRIGLSTRAPMNAAVDRECVAAAEDAARLCESLGHHVEEAAPQFDGDALTRALSVLMRAHMAAGVDAMARITGRVPSLSNVERANFVLSEQGRRVTATELLGALDFFAQTSRQVASFWQRYDLWLTPTLASPPVPHGYISPDDPEVDRYMERRLSFIPFTPLANVTGNPAMSVPLYWSEAGLPIGSHFVGRFGDEATLFRLAGQLERARPWVQRKPPVSIWT